MLLQLVKVLRLKVIDNYGKVTNDLLSLTNTGNCLLLAAGEVHLKAHSVYVFIL